MNANYKAMIITAILILSVSIAAFHAEKPANASSSQINMASVRQEGTKLKEPTPAPAAPAPAPTQEVAPVSEPMQTELEKEIKDYLGDRADKVGLVYYDINSQRSIIINGDKEFTAASTFKVPLNMIFFKRVKSGTVDINEKLQYQASDYEEGTGILQGEDLSAPLPLKDLSDDSIIYSDNIATNMILNRLGYDSVKNEEDAILGHTTDHSGNYMTPNEAAIFLKILYQNSNHNPYYDHLIDIMKHTEFHDRIDAKIPQDIVAHKVGNYGAYVNDIGIIYTPKPYILAVYTEDLPGAENVISDISQMIYNKQSQQ